MSIETPRWAESVESLLSNGRERKVCDVLIIGSGYGGSFAARELAGSGDVWVVERGREYALGEFPEDIGSLPGHVRFSRRSKAEITGKPEALFDFRVFDDVSVLVANGLGGGSLINAGVALPADRETFVSPEWPSELADRRRDELCRIMGEVSKSLQASELSGGKVLKKFQALEFLARQAEWPAPKLVPLTIASERRTNSAGLDQAACTRCGNCLTGCNVGAKNTLVSHVIPEAVRAGVRFFTGGTALELEPWDAEPAATDSGRAVRWRVKFARTVDAKAQGGPVREPFEIAAHVVILAAGALGSTELLLRSPRVTHSGRLGKNFSTNGDLIAMGWGMKDKIDGISAPRADCRGPGNNVGPTIVGTIRAPLKVGSKAEVLLQDGAVPSALAQSAIALGAALSTAHRYSRNARPEPYADADPLSTPAAIGEHALVLLGMGKDPGRATVSLVKASEASGKKSRVQGNLQVQWDTDEKKKSHRYHQDFDDLLLRAEKAGGLQGGDYLSNPAWRPFPTDFSVITGDPPHKMVTVHPLGGCPMGNDGRTGVVDWKGAVFNGNGGMLHAGLHVMDGAILPASLGVNPFLTISALSVLAARQLRAELDQTRRSPEPRPGRPLPVQQPTVPLLPFQPAGPIVLSFEERLQGTVAGETPGWLDALAVASWPERTKYTAQRDWVVKVKVTLDLHAWLANPALPLDATLTLYENRFPHESSVMDEAVRVLPVLEGTGKVRLLALDRWPLSTKESSRRAREAYATYIERRSRLDLKSATSGDNPLNGIRAFWRAGRNHGWQRCLTYEFALTQPCIEGGQVFQARGEKRLAYARGEKNLWHALTQLDLQISPGPTATDAAEMRLKVDLVDMVRNNRLQIVQAPNTPAAIVGLAAFASIWVRGIFTTHFWSFRGSIPLVMPPPAQHEPLWPDGPAKESVEPVACRFRVDRGSAAPGKTINLELTRYQPNALQPLAQQGGTGKHVLLIHGLAHGGAVFTTDTVGTHNMATAFVQDGYTVWVLDHRLSNRLPYRLQNHTMDDLAAYDIPAAVAHVFHQAGCKIKVFAHCVGAAAFSMAALSGRLHCASGSMIESAVIHAVHPWLVPSASNQLSAALAALYKDLLEDDDSVDPLPRDKSWVLRGLRKKDDSDDLLPDDGPRMFERILDRFAATIPWADDEMERHERHKYDPQGGCAVCNRMTVFYGREWVHANLADATHEQLGSLFGSAGIEVFRQLFFVLTRERLTDRQGDNAYLTQERVTRNFTFPVLFCHGRDNQVFDPRGAVRSWNRLKHLRKFSNNQAAVKLFVAQAYGHMDFLFGKDAHRDIYPRLLRFLDDPGAFEDTWTWNETGPPCPPSEADWELSDYDYHTPRSLLTGPMIQLDENKDRKELIVWFEQSQHTTSEATPPTLSDATVPAGSSTFQWQVVNLKTRIQGECPLPRLLNGAGVFWSATLAESFPGQFSVLPTARVGLGVQDPDIKNVTFGLRTLRPIRVTDLEVNPLAGTRRFTGDMSTAPETYDSQIAAELNWSGLSWWKRWVGVRVEAPVSWLASSCRWPGLPFERDGPDQLACAMQAHVTDAKLPVDALVMLGDQIYADATADVADTAEMEERGPKRYRDAWGGQHTRKLLASIPSYMVVDDHEFRDGWGVGDRPWRDPKFINGFHAALAYQWRWRADGDLPRITETEVSRGFWRTFKVGDIPAFAADTRTERRPAPCEVNWEQKQLMTEAQFLALENWMWDHKDQPKILCSGAVFGIPEEYLVRDPSLCRSADGWLAYPAAWKRIARFIALKQIQNVIFLSGDLHLSAIAELQIEACGAVAPVRAISVACSGWNATLPFANRRARDIVCGDRIAAPLGGSDVQVFSTSRVLSTAYRQFSKLTLQPVGPGWELQVRVYGEGNVEIPLEKPCRLRL